SSNNAKEGGALVPTLAFGVPGSASMALLLGAFLIHGVAPGPNMLGAQLDITFTLIWTVALANILGAGACFLLAGQFARVDTLRAGLLVPLVFSVMVIGAFQGAKDYGDLVVLLIFGFLGWVMKRLGWPRPPMILAFVLGGLIENYLFISHLRYGVEWMLKPVPFVLLCIGAFMLLRPLFGRFRLPRVGARADAKAVPQAGTRVAHATGMELVADLALWAGAVAFFAYVFVSASGWDLAARLMPQSIVVLGLAAALGFGIFRLLGKIPPLDPPDTEPLTRVAKQGLWILGLVVAVRVIGMLPAVALFAASYMLAEGHLSWKRTVLILVPFMAGLYFLFHETLHVPWPQSLLGELWPWLRAATGRLL
ncbi:MAG TPA: tripartite tricarboxylate transporter permease, partial [Kiloniellales bacterium]|nr:tripartite tricarboxylate transporter permease [Kiloniellales bacterium]